MRVLFTALMAVFVFTAKGQFPDWVSSSDIYHELQKAESDVRILYVAAHPDDENTRLISYFENAEHFRTAYLSLTRGDGGQNLIGTEIGAAIGVLRTQELLAARSVDGGEQFFTRAVDFGYSKSSEETFDKWERELILGDVVWAIRKFRPHLIVTRFPPTNYAGHGHHKASAILAEEAFELAGNPNAYPEQLDLVSVWSPKSMYHNTSTWWVKTLDEDYKKDDNLIRFDVGLFNPVIGESYAQIAARSRSQHRSQGFGSDYPDGTQIEYLSYVKGVKFDPKNIDIQSLSQDWADNNLEVVHEKIENVISKFDFKSPDSSIDELVSIAKSLRSVQQSTFVDQKIKEIEELIVKCLNLELTLDFESKYLVKGSSNSARLRITNPSTHSVKVHSAHFGNSTWTFDESLENNQTLSDELSFEISQNAGFSNPYWLNVPFEGTYSVANREDIGKPENDPALYTNLSLQIDDYQFEYQLEGYQKTVDPARGVIFTPVNIVPEVSFNFSENVLIATDSGSKRISVTVTSHKADVNGVVNIELPNGWTCEPSSHNLSFNEAESSKLISFDVRAGTNSVSGAATLMWSFQNQKEAALSLQEIEYEHIPSQIILTPASMQLKAIPLDRGGVNLVGYIEGPGDDVAKYLRAAGYIVDIIEPEDLLDAEKLNQYDAVVTGIRAYNTRDDLASANDILNDYVASGGTWIVQYQTSRGVKTDQIGPYSFELSRERVTDEFAMPMLLNDQHPIFIHPNPLTPEDWNDWVQERGLYFAGEWAPEFEPLIAWNDIDEPERKGGLIVASHGEGHFVYTGISFFRELPAGVPGAYRLLANILSLSKDSSAND